MYPVAKGFRWGVEDAFVIKCKCGVCEHTPDSPDSGLIIMIRLRLMKTAY